jgi:hypothetical protein
MRSLLSRVVSPASEEIVLLTFSDEKERVPYGSGAMDLADADADAIERWEQTTC